MKILALCALFLLAAGCASLKGESREQQTVALAQAHAGPGAKNCGVLTGANPDPGLACSHGAQAYWFAVDYGPDGWWAIAVSPSGARVLIHPGQHYDASSRPVAEPCERLEIRDVYDRQPMVCWPASQPGA